MISARGDAAKARTESVGVFVRGGLLEDGGKQVDVAHRRFDDPRLRLERPLHDQRHVDELFVEVAAVLPVAMLAERFTVIRRQDDEGAIEKTPGSELIEETPDLSVHVSDLRIVESNQSTPIRLGGHATALHDAAHERRDVGGATPPISGETLGEADRVSARRGEALLHRSG